MRGVKRKPSQLLRLEGSSQFRKPHRQNTEPEPPDGEPGCPTWLDREGKAEWRRATASLREMGMLKACDRGMLAMLCQNWSEAVKYSRMLNGLREIASMQDARRLKSMGNESWGRYAKGCECFGLEPSARARLHVPGGGKKTDDEYAEFMGKRRA